MRLLVRVGANHYRIHAMDGEQYDVTNSIVTNYWTVKRGSEELYSNNRLERCIDHVEDKCTYQDPGVHHNNRVDSV